MISVIIPAWNAEAYIGRALDSVLGPANASEVEVLVIDDASTDKTGAVVKGYADRRLRYLRRDQNGGAALARNDGFAAARGDWVALLDADDQYEPGRLATLTRIGDESQADIVADNFWIISEAHPQERRLFIPEALDGGQETYSLAQFARANRLFDAAKPSGYLKPLFRRSFLQQHGLAYDPALRIGEDYHLVAQALLAGAKYVRHHSAGYVYTTREGSISHRLRSADVAAMARASRELLAKAQETADPPARAALAAHLDSLEDGLAFVRLIEALKARQAWPAAQIGLARPSALRHLAMPLQARLRRLGARLGLADQAEERRSLS